MSEEKKRLTACETAIGKFTGKVNGKEIPMTLYYGNVSLPKINGRIIHIDDKLYRKKLVEFLSSEAGRQYQSPSPDEINKAAQDALQWERVQTGNYSPSEEEKAEKARQDALAAIMNGSTTTAVVSASQAEQAAQEEEQEESVAKKPVRTKSVPKKVKEEEPEDDDDDTDEDADEDEDYDDEEDDEDEGSGIGSKILAVVTILTTAAALALAAMMVMNINPLHPSAATKADKTVLALTSDVTAGTQITDDMLTEKEISDAEFNDLSGKEMFRADGTSYTEYAVLSGNKDKVVGQYASANMKAGDVLTTADYSASKIDGETMSLTVNGKTVTIPVSQVKSGNSSVQLYAIVTTTDDNGDSFTNAIKMGDVNMEGRTLTDFKAADGTDVVSTPAPQQ